MSRGEGVWTRLLPSTLGLSLGPEENLEVTYGAALFIRAGRRLKKFGNNALLSCKGHSLGMHIVPYSDLGSCFSICRSRPIDGHEVS